MLQTTLSSLKKTSKERKRLVKSLNEELSRPEPRSTHNPAVISEYMKDITYIRQLADSNNPAELNDALMALGLPMIDSRNPAVIDEQRRLLYSYLMSKIVSGNPITINILGNLTPEVTRLKVTMNPIQDTSQGNPSPTNICPISGRTEASVKRTGKNEIDEDFLLLANGWTKSGGEYSGLNSALHSAFSGGYSGDIKFLENTQYTASFDFKADENKITVFGFKYSDGTKSESYLNNTTYERKNFTSTINKTVVGILFSYGGSTTVHFKNFQLEQGSTATPYEPYTAETKTHQYSDTIYGGVDDFVNGELSVEWGYIASYDEETLPGEWISDRDVYAPNTTPTIGAEVAYKLSEAVSIETTPEEITLLKGENVLSTDGDSIEIRYKQNFT